MVVGNILSTVQYSTEGVPFPGVSLAGHLETWALRAACCALNSHSTPVTLLHTSVTSSISRHGFHERALLSFSLWHERAGCPGTFGKNRPHRWLSSFSSPLVVFSIYRMRLSDTQLNELLSIVNRDSCVSLKLFRLVSGPQSGCLD